jgi:hypothetical protein
MKCSTNLNSDFHKIGSDCRLLEPYSPTSDWVGKPPSFEEAVSRELIKPYIDLPFSDTCKGVLDALRYEVDIGQICTFDEVASHVNRQLSELEPERALNPPIFSAQCREAQAMYDSRKVCWLLERIRCAANRIVSPAWGRDIKASHQHFSNADTHRLHELDGFPSAPSVPVGASGASTIPPATLLIRKRKRKIPHKDPRRYALNGKALLPRECPHPQCDRTFSGLPSDQKSNLQRHIEHKHSDPSQVFAHICPVCGRDFPRRDYLLNHMRGRCLQSRLTI